jgi:hypothetical protein
MASRFWVGGTGTWDATNTANWSATTGGASGASVPTSADDVTFNASSGTSFTVTIATGYNPTVISVSGGAATVTLNLNDQTLTCTTFSFTGTAVRTLAWGTSGQIVITGNGTTVFTTQVDTNLTCSGSRNVVFTYSGSTGTRTIGTPPLTNIATNSLNYIFQGGTDTVTLTGASGIVSRDLDLTGFSGTFTTNQMFAYGNVTLSAGLTLTAVATTWNFRGPSGGTQTLTTAGKTLPVSLTVNAPSGTVLFADNVTIPTTATLTVTAGTLNSNNRTINIGRLVSTGTATRTLAFGTSTLNITGNAATVMDVTPITGLTITGLTTVTFTYAGAVGNRTITLNSLFTEAQAFNIVITGGSDVVILGGGMRDLDFTGFSGTLNASARIIYGNLTLGTGMTVASGATSTSFNNTTGTTTIDTKGRTFQQQMTFAGTGGTRRLLGNVDLGVRNAAFTAGNLDLNDFTLTAFTAVSSGTLARQIQFGNTGAINLTANGQTTWSFGTATGFSYTGNGRVNLTYAGATGIRSITHGSTAGGSEATQAPPMYVAAGATDTITTTNLSYWSDLVFEPGANVTLSNTSKFVSGNVILAPGMTITAGTAGIAFIGNGIQTFDSANLTTDFPLTVGSGTSNGNLRLANTTTIGNSRLASLASGTLDLNGQTLTVGTWGSTGSFTRAIYQNGGTFNVDGFNTTVWTMTNSTGFSYPTRPVVNFTYAGSLGTRSVSIVSTANNTIDFNIVSGSDSFSLTPGFVANNVNFVGFTGTLGTTIRSLYGNLTLGTGMTTTAGSGTTSFIGTTGNQTLVTNGVAIDFPIIINSTGGNFVLSEPLAIGSTRTLTLTSGNLLANGYNITAGLFNSSNTNNRVIDISNVTVTLSGTGTVWNMAATGNATFTATNSNINLSNTSTTARTFAGGNLTYGNLDIGGATGTSTLTVTGNNTFAGALTSTKTVAHTIQFAETSTTTVGGFTVSGSLGAVVTLTSSTAAPHNLVLTGGGTVNTVSYLDISYSNASPATDTWFAGTNSVDSGNNTGWIFPEPSSSNFFLLF